MVEEKNENVVNVEESQKEEWEKVDEKTWRHVESGRTVTEDQIIETIENEEKIISNLANELFDESRILNLVKYWNRQIFGEIEFHKSVLKDNKAFLEKIKS